VRGEPDVGHVWVEGAADFVGLVDVGSGAEGGDEGCVLLRGGGGRGAGGVGGSGGSGGGGRAYGVGDLFEAGGGVAAVDGPAGRVRGEHLVGEGEVEEGFGGGEGSGEGGGGDGVVDDWKVIVLAVGVGVVWRWSEEGSVNCCGEVESERTAAESATFGGRVSKGADESHGRPVHHRLGVYGPLETRDKHASRAFQRKWAERLRTYL
jgi:hypothetical protein